MNVKRISTALAGALLMLAGIAHADDGNGPRAGQFYVVPGVNFIGENDEQDINAFIGADVGVGLQLTDRFALELHYAEGNTEFDGGGNVDIDVDSWRLEGNYIFGGDEWKRYFVLGAGEIDFDPDVGSNFDDELLVAGVGVMRSFTPRFSMRTDLRGWYQVDEEETTPGISVGLRYVVAGPVGPKDSDGDGVTDPSDQCPDTPPNTAVNMHGCVPDGDNDGVPDVSDQCPRTPAGVAVDNSGCAPDNDRDGVADYRDDCLNTPRGDEVDGSGCTIVPPVETIELALEFDFDSSALRPNHYPEIERVADFMKRHDGVSAQLEGHTDSRGSDAYNQALSERRAYSVRDYLIDEANIDPRRITAVGYGEAQPVASNETDDGRQRNRRVRAVISTGDLDVRPRRAD